GPGAVAGLRQASQRDGGTRGQEHALDDGGEPTDRLGLRPWCLRLGRGLVGQGPEPPIPVHVLLKIDREVCRHPTPPPPHSPCRPAPSPSPVPATPRDPRRPGGAGWARTVPAERPVPP